MLKDLLGDPDEFKVYGQENVTNGDFERGRRWLDSRRFAELANYALRAGDLMLTRKGSIGNCFTFSAGAQPGIIDSDTIRIRLDEDVLVSEYTLTLLHDADYIAKQIDLTKRGAILASLNTSVVGNLAILRPPKGEQAEINKFIARERNAFDTLTETATSAITLLQERRAALISAAVTGKIDVRDAQAVPAQALQVSAMVAGVVIAGHWRQPNFGRVKLQKFLYLAQTHAGIPEIGGEFLREAAGPLDRQLQGQVEAELTAVGAIQVEQELGAGTAVRYQFQGDAAALAVVDDLCRVLGRALYNLVVLLDLQRISLGGSVFWHHRDFLLPRLQAQVSGHFPALTQGVLLVPAGLGNTVGDYAALALA